MDVFFSLLFFVGAVQALLLIVGINLKKPLDSPLKRFTSLLMLAIAIVSLYYIVILNRIELVYPYIDSLGSAAWMAICPIYFIISRMLVKRMAPSWRDGWMFLLPLLFVAEAAWTTCGVDITIFSLADSNQQFIDVWMVAFFTTGLFFMLRSVWMFRKGESILLLKGAFAYSIILFCVLLAFAVVYLLVRHAYTFTFEYILIALLQLLVFLLVYRLFKFASFHTIVGMRSYSNSKQDSAENAALAARLEKCMLEAQPFLNSKLDLPTLSTLAETTPNALSQLFNAHYKSSFYAFVAGYRIDYAEQLLTSPDASKYTITAIAEMSGFASKATFYKAFRSRHGVTPSVWLKGRG